jgi:long-chain fatty acid transport protein
MNRLSIVTSRSGGGFYKRSIEDLIICRVGESESNMRRYSRPLSFAVACVLACSARMAFAGGIEVPMQDAKSLGQADAFTAQADDPSAIFYNPAGLTQLKGTSVSAGAFYLQPEFRLEGTDGSNSSMRLPSVLPHLYAESDMGTNHWRFGIGIDNVYGINEDYGSTGALRTLVDEAQLSVINIAPTVAYKIDPSLSVGLAFNIYYGDLLLTRQVTLGPPPTPEGQFHLRGSAVGFGVTPGFMWKINDQNTIGAYYRSPFSLDFNGTAELKIPHASEVGPSDAQAALEFPQSAGIGYAFRPVKRLKLEGDVIWTDWHAVSDLQIQSQDPHFNNQTLPAHWISGFTFRGGVQYDLTDHWALRAGYAYSQNSVPNSTFSPLVPDSNYHLFAMGGGYSAPSWDFNVAATYIYRETHDVAGSVDSPLVNGTWNNHMYGLMATFTYRL